MRLLPDSQSPFPQAPASPPPRSRSPSHDAAVRPVEQGGGSGPGGAALTTELREIAPSRICASPFTQPHRCPASRSASLASAHPRRPASPPPCAPSSEVEDPVQPRRRLAPRVVRWRIRSGWSRDPPRALGAELGGERVPGTLGLRVPYALILCVPGAEE